MSLILLLEVDWEGKVALIQCAKAMGIQKYVFFSIHNCDKHPEVPLMEIKYCTEKFLKDSGINHVVIRLCGFMQVAFRSQNLVESDGIGMSKSIDQISFIRNLRIPSDSTNE